jgi:hypothetical protein
VRGLRDDQEIGRLRPDRQRFRSLAAILDAGMRPGRCQLRGTPIAGNDGIEMFGKRDRRLPVAGRDVDGEPPEKWSLNRNADMGRL